MQSTAVELRDYIVTQFLEGEDAGDLDPGFEREADGEGVDDEGVVVDAEDAHDVLARRGHAGCSSAIGGVAGTHSARKSRRRWRSEPLEPERPNVVKPGGGAAACSA